MFVAMVMYDDVYCFTEDPVSSSCAAWVCSLMEQKIDRLTEITTELTRRLQRAGGEGGPAKGY